LNEPPFKWMENARRMGGGLRAASGRVTLTDSLPPIADLSVRRNDFLPSYPGNWSRWALQEKDFHDGFNGGGATVRNLKGERFFLSGDGAFEATDDTTHGVAEREVIAEGARASLQSLFDAYLELGTGRTVEEIGARGSSFFAALRSLPIFVESNPQHTFEDEYGFEWTIGNNFNGQWTLYAQAVDAIAGTSVVPNTSPLPCQMQYVDGDIEIDELNSSVTPCTTFPVITPPAHTPNAVMLAQNAPNPFDATTFIRFELQRDAHVKLAIYDLAGSEVATIVDGVRSAGVHVQPWNVAGSGRTIRSGVYFYRLTVDGSSRSRKLAIVR